MNTTRIILAVGAAVILAAFLGWSTLSKPVEIIGPAPVQFQSNL